MNKGDIVLVPFPFTDLSGNKNRPAVILLSSEEDITICFITSQLKFAEDTDIIAEPSLVNGLKKISLIRPSKMATIDKELVIGRLGTLEDHYIHILNKTLIKILKLG